MSTRPPPRPRFETVIHFEGVGNCYWQGGTWKCPDKGDWYLSGAIVEAYRARQHLTTEYWCVTPTHYAAPTQGFRRAEPIQFTQDGIPLPRYAMYPYQ